MTAAKACFAGEYPPTEKEKIMAKGQKRSNKEVRKPKANPPKKTNASAPSLTARGLGPKAGA